MKKAQGLPMNVIIIAAIALIVLVVIVVIFTGKARTFTAETGSCASQGGKCAQSLIPPQQSCPAGWATISNKDPDCTCCIEI